MFASDFEPLQLEPQLTCDLNCDRRIAQAGRTRYQVYTPGVGLRLDHRDARALKSVTLTSLEKFVTGVVAVVHGGDQARARDLKLIRLSALGTMTPLAIYYGDCYVREIIRIICNPARDQRKALFWPARRQSAVPA